MKSKHASKYLKIEKLISNGAPALPAIRKYGVNPSGFYGWRKRRDAEVVIHEATPKRKYQKKLLQKSPQKFAVVFLTLEELAGLR